MTNAFWIWKSNLPGILSVISEIGGFDFDQNKMDEIKYGLIHTSDEKENWFEFEFNKTKIKIAIDHEDNDIVHMQLYNHFPKNEVRLLSILGTNFELKTKAKRIE